MNQILFFSLLFTYFKKSKIALSMERGNSINAKQLKAIHLQHYSIYIQCMTMVIMMIKKHIGETDMHTDYLDYQSSSITKDKIKMHKTAILVLNLVTKYMQIKSETSSGSFRLFRIPENVFIKSFFFLTAKLLSV